MSTTVLVRNCGQRAFALKTMGTIAANVATTKSRVLKQVVADDTSVNFNNAAKFGVQISENGVDRAGTVVHNAAATVATTTYLALVDMGANLTLTLPTLASVPDGHRLTILLRTATAGTLTVDGNGAETVLGTATQTATTVNYVLRIMKKLSSSSTNWVAQTI